MNSKDMSKWSGIFICLAALALIYIIASGSNQGGGAYSLLLMSAIFNVGSAIMKKLESIEGNLK